MTGNTIKTREGRAYAVLSGWLKLRTFKKGDAFSFARKTYYLDSFEPLTYPEFYDTEDGKLGFLSYVEKDNYRDPILLEIHPDAEYVRVLREI